MNIYKHITGGTTNPLISKFITGGEVNPSESSKQYAETVLERFDNYEVNTDLNSGPYIRDYLHQSNTPTPQEENSEDKRNRLKSMSFLRKWYTNPVTLQMMSQNDYNNYEKFGVRAPTGKVVTYPDDARQLLVMQTLSKTPVEYISLPDQILGRHIYNSADVSKNKIQMNSNHALGQKYTFTHEFDHALQYQLPWIKNPIQKFEHKLKPGIIKDPYLDSPGEIRSRIMEFRQYHNLSPEKRDYTAEEAAEMQKKTEGMDGYIGGVTDLNRLDPQTLANYLNYLASNTKINNSLRNSTRNNIAFVKYGGILTSRQYNYEK